MREIKFRAWHKNRKTFLDFYWAVDKFGRTFSILDKCVYDDFTDEVELMQYTGLKDVNGVDIYEGDILLDSNGVITGSVRFEDGSYMVEEYYLWEYNFESKVIGNKFQNPELLEVSE